MEKNETSRIEKVREEIKKATAFGLQPPSFIPLGKNFRTEGLMPVLFSHDTLVVPDGNATLNSLENKSGILADKEPKPLVFSPKILTELIRYQLEAISDHNHGEIAPQVLKLFSELSSQVRDYSTIASLHKEVLTKVFGTDYFTKGGEAKIKAN